MNYTNAKKLAKFIEGRKVNMAVVIRDPRYDENSEYSDDFVERHEPTCDTVGCILGWCQFYLKERGIELNSKHSCEKFLGLGGPLGGRDLFCPNGYSAPPKNQAELVQKVLRGEIMLTDNWLHNPQERKSAKI